MKERQRKRLKACRLSWAVDVGNLTFFFTVPPWASLSDVREFGRRISRIEADLLCELIGVIFFFLS